MEITIDVTTVERNSMHLLDLGIVDKFLDISELNKTRELVREHCPFPIMADNNDTYMRIFTRLVNSILWERNQENETGEQ